jgi:hypothetical protein
LELGTEFDLELLKGKQQFSAQEAEKYITDNMRWTSIEAWPEVHEFLTHKFSILQHFQIFYREF